MKRERESCWDCSCTCISSYASCCCGCCRCCCCCSCSSCFCCCSCCSCCFCCCCWLVTVVSSHLVRLLGWQLIDRCSGEEHIMHVGGCPGTRGTFFPPLSGTMGCSCLAQGPLSHLPVRWLPCKPRLLEVWKSPWLCRMAPAACGVFRSPFSAGPPWPLRLFFWKRLVSHGEALDNCSHLGGCKQLILVVVYYFNNYKSTVFHVNRY